jgi:hypothetical protein
VIGFVLLLVVLALLGASCGATSSPTSPDSSSARLYVRQVIATGSPLPAEGAYSYIRVVQADGSRVVAERRLPDSRRPSATLSLSADRYRLESWQRTCNGNCGDLDPPSERCARRFRLQSGEQRTATITVRYASGCWIALR